MVDDQLDPRLAVRLQYVLCPRDPSLGLIEPP
jgi:hypothetical protein